MTTKLIKIDTNWIVISDKEIKTGDVYYNFDYNCFRICVEVDKEFVRNALFYENDSTVFDYSKDCKKVLFSQNPEHNLPTITFSDEVAKELGIVDVVELSENVSNLLYDHERFRDTAIKSIFNVIYQEAYNQCLSDNADKRFTLEDMINFADYCLQKVDADSINSKQDFHRKVSLKYHLKNFQLLAKEEYFCELEMEKVFDKNPEFYGTGMFNNATVRPKITNNSVKILRVWK